jgi:ATP-binding cassette subfamily F protein uup
MSILTLDEIKLQFGDHVLFRGASMSLEPGERVCLVGRNGAGKSTLLKMIMGRQDPDEGEMRMRQNLRVSELKQTLPQELDETVHEHVSKGLAHLKQLIHEYGEHSQTELDEAGLRELQDLTHRIEAEGGWNPDVRVDTVLSEMDLPPDAKLSDLSGGWQRRVDLARALVSNPEMLLLDEPTNHLDLSAIEWLEDRVKNYSQIQSGCVLFITHDRAFLDRLATRIIELDLGRFLSFPGNYKDFLRRKEEMLEVEKVEKADFAKKLAIEEAWVRQGIKARRTRNEGRVRALEEMRVEAAERGELKRAKGPRIHIEGTEQVSGRKVLELFNVQHRFATEDGDGPPLIKDLSLKIMRGERVGLVGNNGVGKSTLLKLLLGELSPTRGTIKLGTNLQIAYFDQMRRELDPEATIVEVIGEGRDYITLNGKQRHVIGYLTGFLFSAKRAKTPIKALSGGECNRVILAKLFTRPSNLLVLDEPTNDLDVETLEVLEAKLAEYEGTLLIVSHDREFLDNVVTSVLVFEEGGKITRYPGGFSDWARKGQALAVMDDPDKVQRKSARAEAKAAAKAAAPRKMTYGEKLELRDLPAKIEHQDGVIATLEAQIADPDFYAQGYEVTQPVLDELEREKGEAERLTARWLDLEELANT